MPGHGAPADLKDRLCLIRGGNKATLSHLKGLISLRRRQAKKIYILEMNVFVDPHESGAVDLSRTGHLRTKRVQSTICEANWQTSPAQSSPSDTLWTKIRPTCHQYLKSCGKSPIYHSSW
jgi:hypothetical protein